MPRFPRRPRPGTVSVGLMIPPSASTGMQPPARLPAIFRFQRRHTRPLTGIEHGAEDGEVRAFLLRAADSSTE
jgi:hypothetical protein